METGGPKGKLMNDLRNSHFAFGTTPYIDYSSTAKASFYDMDVQINKTESIQNAPARRTNIRIGHENPAYYDKLQSNYSSHYLSYTGNSEVAKQNNETKADLRNHHFRLGFTKNNKESQTSEAKSHYQPKQRNDSIVEEMKKTKQFSETSNGFFTDDKKYYNSMYGETYNANTKGDPNEVFSKEDLDKRRRMLRKSNIMMGNCHNNNSLTSGDFNNKLDESKKLNNKEGDLKSKAALTNLKLTGDNGDWATMARCDYNKQPLPKDDKEGKKKNALDLRQAHFTLGYDPAENTSEFQGQFKPISKEDAQQDPVDYHKLQSHHYKFGGPAKLDPKNIYQSSYNRDLGSINPSEAIRPSPFLSKANKNRSDILIGTKDGSKVSEQKGNFTDPVNSSGQNAHKMMNLNYTRTNIPSTNFRTNYTTVYKDQHGDKNDSFNKVSLNEEAKSILRKTNFSYGMRPVIPETTHDANFKQREGGGTQTLNPQMMKDLKGNHLQYGTDKENWNTTSKSYLNWKQPQKNMYASKI